MINKPTINGITKDDTLVLECSLDYDVTDWKIRCEIYDDNTNSIKLATANSGGSDDQIEVTQEQPTASIFLIKIPSGETSIFACGCSDEQTKVMMEIEVDTGQTVAGKPQILTVFDGFINLKAQKITWETPD